MKIGLLVIATHKYKDYIQQLLDSVDRFFFVGEEVEVHLFSHLPLPVLDSQVIIHWHTIQPFGWPEASLLRYGFFTMHAEKYLRHLDWLFYIDVDARFEKPIDQEILPVSYGPERKGLISLHHTGFADGEGSWETNQESAAFTPEHFRRTYFMGGFNGGDQEGYLHMASILAKWISSDRARGISAVWHDESYLNLYLGAYSPAVVLPRSFSAPEERGDIGQTITWLLKDHEAVRG